MARVDGAGVLLKAVDWEILRQLLRWEGNQPQGALRFPVAEIARRTGSHPNTVRSRLIALRAGGVLEGAMFEPWPRLLGLVREGWMFQGVRLPDEAGLQTLFARFPSAHGAALGLDWMFVHLWEPDQAAARRTAKAMAQSLGSSHHERHFTSDDFPPSPADGLKLMPLDWRLVLALRAGAERSMAAVAKGLRLAPRLAERRAKRLFEAGAGGMFPRLRLARIDGVTIVHFLLREGDARAAASLAQAFPDRLAGPWGKGINAGTMVPVANLAAAEERRRQAERLPGIGRLDILLYKDFAFSDAFERYLADRVDDVATSQPLVAQA
jgi:DNA-binding Lrp family transcriptional regulator